MADTKEHDPATQARIDAVKAFREKHELDQAALDRLLGFSSGGRATRRWEGEGPPPYAMILIAYADKYGLDLMEEMAVQRALSADT